MERKKVMRERERVVMERSRQQKILRILKVKIKVYHNNIKLCYTGYT